MKNIEAEKKNKDNKNNKSTDLWNINLFI
jgi:hypothetical protein